MLLSYILGRMEIVSWYIHIFGITITSDNIKVIGLIAIAILAVTVYFAYRMTSKDGKDQK